MVDEFVALAKRARRHTEAFERDLARMYELLPEVRRAGLDQKPEKYGPTVLETMSERLIPRDTASRRTAAVIGTSRKKDTAEP